MAKVWVRWIDCVQERFPAVCLRCGAPSTCFVHKEFGRLAAWHDAQSLSGNSLSARLPMCEQHRHHWRRRSWAVLAGVAAILACALVFSVVRLIGPTGPLWSSIMFWGLIGVLVAWSVLVCVVLLTGIQAEDIESSGMTLTGVSEAFVSAYRQQTREAEIDLRNDLTSRWDRGSSRLAEASAEAAGEVDVPEDEDAARPFWATVWLQRPDCESGALPGLCIRCGRPAAQRVEQDFFWSVVMRDFAGSLMRGVPADTRLRVPMCARHVNHWRNRRRLLIGALLLPVISGVVLVALVRSGARDDDRFLVIVTTFALGLLGVMVLAILDMTGIRALGVREGWVRLVGVSSRFVAAYERRHAVEVPRLDEAVSRWAEQKPAPDQEGDERVRRDEESGRGHVQG